ncbi:hypothetical protein [Saccharothrix hoggarensis]|uniref:Immunity protein 63 of polymorphic toxin system n=1 Tax=Saccharothrix hoggarensis TaxID=913853 RepID=A0ABW3QN37_9PSEU
MTTETDPLRAVYHERAHLPLILTALFGAVMAEDPQDDVRPHTIYFDTPEGQMSWHIDQADLYLFEHVERVRSDDLRACWDGHSTPEKYRRLRALTATLGRVSGLREMIADLTDPTTLTSRRR